MLKIELSVSKEYEVEFFNSKYHQSFPAHVAKELEDGEVETKNVASAAFESLTSGKTIVNLRGSAIDCVMLDPLSSGGLLVRALCLAHTEQDLKLLKEKLITDQTNAMNAVTASPLLSTAKCITVHISNRNLHQNIKPSTMEDCVVIGQHNLSAFFGPVLSRAMLSNIQNTPAAT
jgi:hypothetical protein